jgi:hypothetical protein
MRRGLYRLMLRLLYVIRRASISLSLSPHVRCSAVDPLDSIFRAAWPASGHLHANGNAAPKSKTTCCVNQSYMPFGDAECAPDVRHCLVDGFLARMSGERNAAVELITKMSSTRVLAPVTSVLVDPPRCLSARVRTCSCHACTKSMLKKCILEHTF